MSDIYTLSMMLSLALFILTTHITPGPTNIIILTSVLQFGYKRSFPYMMANVISYPLLMIFTGIGIGLFLTQHPNIMSILKVIGIAYLLWMAWKIFNDTTSYNTDESTKTRPFTFLQGLIYPWINPKAWIVYTSTASLFVTSAENSSLQITFIVSIIFLAMIITVYTWAFGGVIIKKFLTDQKSVDRINKTMAFLLVVSIIPILF